MPLLGCIADDFTGATDLASTLVRQGMRTVQLIGTPDGPAPEADALVVALKIRTAPVAEAVRAAKGGQVQFKVEKAGIVHAGVGKASFDAEKLAENIRAFVDAVSRAKPSGAKGAYMKRVSIASTMGPGVSVDLASATGNA